MAMTIRQAAPINGAAVLPDVLVAQQLRQGSDDDAALIGVYRATALQWVEKRARVSMQRRAWLARFDGFSTTVRLPIGPVVSVATVTYDNPAASSVDGAGLWRLAGEVLSLAFSTQWPAIIDPAGATIVEFVAGTADATTEYPHLCAAALMLIQHLYDGGNLNTPPAAVTMLCDVDRVPVIG